MRKISEQVLTESEILKHVCQKLEEANIPYMLTGSFAANFYAVPRMTRDIDIVVEIRDSSVDTLFQIFKDDFYINKLSIEEAVAHEGMFNMIHNESIFKIDFIVRKNSEYRSIEFQRKCRIQLDQTSVCIVAPEDLVISKLVWAKDSMSEMQLKDVKNLLRSLKNLDREYIHKWVQVLEINHVYEKVNIYE